MLGRERERAKRRSGPTIKANFWPRSHTSCARPDICLPGWATLIARAKLTKQTTRSLWKQSSATLGSMARLIDDLLDVSRIITGNLIWIASHPILCRWSRLHATLSVQPRRRRDSVSYIVGDAECNIKGRLE